MKKEITEYIAYVLKTIEEKNGVTKDFTEEMLIRIGFYKHERLIHLIVTMTFAVMTVLSFVILMLKGGIGALLLSLLFLALVIPYIAHYYFLENNVQKLYKLYYKAKNLLKERENL